MTALGLNFGMYSFTAGVSEFRVLLKSNVLQDLLHLFLSGGMFTKAHKLILDALDHMRLLQRQKWKVKVDHSRLDEFTLGETAAKEFPNARQDAANEGDLFNEKISIC